MGLLVCSSTCKPTLYTEHKEQETKQDARSRRPSKKMKATYPAIFRGSHSVGKLLSSKGPMGDKRNFHLVF